MLPDIALHPGLGIALSRFAMNETDVAKAMAAGELTSPQKFANSYYFRIRISGTGFSYRPKLDEYVFRPVEVYISPDFLDRCNGLPVIWLHPEKMSLDTKELHRRIVGTVVLPYIGDADGRNPESKEVWGVARIMDLEAAAEMRNKQLSTSPAVDFGEAAADLEKFPVDDGRHLLAETNPQHIDHVAICAGGVWDKMGPPSGIDRGKPPEGMDSAQRADDAGGAGDLGEQAMADTEDKTEEQKAKDRKEAEDRKEADAKRDDAKKLADEGGTHEKPDEELKDMVRGIADSVGKMAKRQDEIEKRIDSMRDDSRRDDRKRDDEDEETERRQAAELEKLAAEEEASADKEKDDAKKRDDARHRDDSRHRFARRDDESEDEHSDRVNDAACRSDAARFKRRDDEKKTDHSKRSDAAFAKHHKRDDSKRDDTRRDDKKADARRDDDKRDDTKRDDKMRDDGKRDDSAETIRDLKSLVRGQQSELDELKRKVGPREPADERQLADTQARADSVYSKFGERAPQPMLGESATAYQIRLARKMQAHSKIYKGEDLSVLAMHSPTAFGAAIDSIYADATTASASLASAESGVLIPLMRQSSTGHYVTEFKGDNAVWMDKFSAPYGVGRLKDPRARNRS